MVDFINDLPPRRPIDLLVEGRREAIATNTCVRCDTGSNLVFRDEISKREYEISGLCQKCQDDIYGEEE